LLIAKIECHEGKCVLLVIENLLERDEILSLRQRLSDAPWKDGGETAGTRSAAVKQNLQLGLSEPVTAELGNAILRKLGHHPMFVSASLAEKIFPPIFNLYQNGGHYGTHVDSALMRVPSANITIRSDISATVFLSDPDEYDGGELIVESDYGAQEVKLPAGDMILYPSNSLHQVAPVTRGQRVAAITWIQSAVADNAARAMLFDLDQSIQNLAAMHTQQDANVDRLIHVYHNLLRRWSQV